MTDYQLSVAMLNEQQRAIIRPVALAYRRARKADKHQTECFNAAFDEYRRLCPDAPADRSEVFARVAEIVAAAINADTDWFWKGPDA